MSTVIRISWHFKIWSNWTLFSTMFRISWHFKLLSNWTLFRGDRRIENFMGVSMLWKSQLSHYSVGICAIIGFIGRQAPGSIVDLKTWKWQRWMKFARSILAMLSIQQTRHEEVIGRRIAFQNTLNEADRTSVFHFSSLGSHGSGQLRVCQCTPCSSHQS